MKLAQLYKQRSREEIKAKEKINSHISQSVPQTMLVMIIFWKYLHLPGEHCESTEVQLFVMHVSYTILLHDNLELLIISVSHANITIRDNSWNIVFHLSH